MAGRVVLFGATGYTGRLVAQELVRAGAQPLLAARSADQMEALAQELGGQETQVADVERPDSVARLVGRGDVLISTVGPFVRHGEVALRAAIQQGAHYVDNCGEPSFIRRVHQQGGPLAKSAGIGLMTAFGYDWVPGNLSGATALAEAGERATRVEIAYIPVGGQSVSGGTASTLSHVITMPSYAFRDGRLHTERIGARSLAIEDLAGGPSLGVSMGGSEHLTLPDLHPGLHDVEVVHATGRSARVLPAVTAVLSGLLGVPGARGMLRKAADRVLPGSTGGPDEQERARSGVRTVAVCRDASGDVVHRVQFDGPNAYTFTGRMMAWSAMEAAAGRLQTTGALGPVQAFGLDAFTRAAAEMGLRRR